MPLDLGINRASCCRVRFGIRSGKPGATENGWHHSPGGREATCRWPVIWIYKPLFSGYAGLLDQLEVISGPAMLVRSPNNVTAWFARDLRPISWVATEDTGPYVKLELY